MMNLKHLLAGTVVTAAVTTALVLGSAAGAQAMIFPTPTPIGPGSVSKPIYTVPSLPGFRLPKELWTKYGPQAQPKSYYFKNLPTCSTLFGADFYTELRDSGYALTTDSAVHATQDAQLLALIPTGHSISCDFVKASTGAHIDITLAIRVDDAAVTSRLGMLGYSAPGGPHGWTKTFADGHTEDQDVSSGLGGWALVSSSDGVFADSIGNAAAQSFSDINS